MSTPSQNRRAPTALYPSLLALFQSGRFAQLENQARTVLKQYPDFGPVWKLLGLAACSQRRNEPALWHRAAELLPDDPEVHYNLGDCHRALGQINEAAACYHRVLELSPHELGAFLNLGMIHHQSGRLDQAEAAYRQVQRLKPDLTEAYYNLALLFKQQGRFDEAIEDFSRAIALRPDFIEARNNLGISLAALARQGEAEAAWRHALRLKPDHLPTLFSLTMLLSGQQRWADAEAVLRQMLKINPALPEVHYRLGAALHSLARFNEAETSYRQALRHSPDFAEAHCALGTTLLMLGRQDESEASYRTALRLRPDFPDLHYQKGSLLKRMGRGNEALLHLGLALKANGDWQERLIRLTDPFVVIDGLVLAADKTPGQAATSAAAPSPGLVQPMTLVRGTPEPAPAPAPSGGGRRQRVVLIYPPPWKIPSAQETLPNDRFAPPRDVGERALDGDFATIPYGLLTIAAEARRAGHEVTVLNLSTTAWRDVERAVAGLRADVFGLSVFTSNRRGMGAVAHLIRQRHPRAHIVVGGPFVTALPRATLEHCPEVDTAVIGEGEASFMELLEALGSDRATIGIPGTAWRADNEFVTGPARPRVENLDELASPFDYFSNYVVMTSRGCPSRCSFCGSFATWGKKLRFHSAGNCVDIFSKALARLPVPFLAVKDDTFTAHRKRAVAICEAIVDNGMDFLWSCDTRVDSLDEEVLRKMRLAGCQRISLGVESGAPAILESIHKKTTPGEILEITRQARKFGIHIRYYMILGNRGETPETVRQSIDLIRAGRPSSMTFCALGFCPGTEEWELLRQQHGLGADIFFANDFKELSVATHRQGEWDVLLNQIQCEIGSLGFEFTVAEREAVVGLLPEVHAVHLELANAYLKAARWDEAEAALGRAQALGFPIPGAIDNQRACLALARGDVDAALAALERGLGRVAHPLLEGNRQILLRWRETPAELRGPAPLLNDSVQAHDFQLYEQIDSRSGAMTGL
jgi:radical SAM superfamily enzyme YgiQ (UPF0313 family)/tetratricopeptide (TPR) repeat protein